jgi:vanillate O-demethylase ferredoxin subunit
MVETYPLRVESISDETKDIRSFVLSPPDGGPLPEFEAGAHIDVHVPGGYVRQFSLCNAPTERRHYRIGVLREENGRGGSRAMHECVRSGDLLEVSGPRNFFPLRLDAGRYVLIAGGIGVTPLLSMVEVLRTRPAPFEMHFCTRSPERTPFMDRLTDLVRAGRVICHHDDGIPGRGLDVARLLKMRPDGARLYCCGPEGLMRAVRDAARHWPGDSVHFESFVAPGALDPSPATAAAGDGTFRVRIASSGRTFAVPPHRSILEVLRENGVDVPSSCEAGTCGTCRTRFLQGTPVHRDFVLSDDEQEEFVMVCCARSASPVLVLDL